MPSCIRPLSKSGQFRRDLNSSLMQPWYCCGGGMCLIVLMHQYYCQSMLCMCVNLHGLPLKKKKKSTYQITLLFHLTLKPAFHVIAQSHLVAQKDNYSKCLCISSHFYMLQKGVVLLQRPIIHTHIFWQWHTRHTQDVHYDTFPQNTLQNHTTVVLIVFFNS